MSTTPPPVIDLDEIEAAANPAEERPDYDEADLDRMTDAEREALLAEDADGEAEAEAEAAEPEPEPEPEAAAPEPEPEAPRPDPGEAAQLAALEAQRKATADELKDLRARFNDGLIEADEFDAQTDALLDRRSRIDREMGGLERGISAARAAADAQWAAACQSFIATHPDFVTAAHKDGFNAEIEAVTGDPRFASLSFAQQLERAARRYMTTPEGEALTLVQPEPPKAAAPAKPVITSPDGKAPPKLATEPVPTLASLPAETVDPNESNVAAIVSRLHRESDPEAKERIMARIPPDLMDRVLSYGG